jgi:hypothetical protein
MGLTMFWCALCKTVKLHEDHRARIFCCGNSLMVKVQLLKGRGHDEVELHVEVEDECRT